VKTKIKNYTSSVAPERSIMSIEKSLIENGATGIFKEYGEGLPIGIVFTMNVNGQKLGFKLYARPRAVEKVLLGGYRRLHKDTAKRISEQAAKTAWKILADWVEAQMAMVQLEQRDLLAVFLADSYDPKNNMTVYEKIQTGMLKLLGEGK
jgi:hypothetical protein